MVIKNAESLALIAMTEHGLLEKGWKFKFDRAHRRFGYCSYREKTISLSKPLVELNDQEQVMDTILHEIAHALTGKGNGHNAKWRAKCVEIGARPNRCYSSAEVNEPKPRWLGTCPNGHKTYRHKRRRISCGRCSPKWNPELMFVWSENE